MKRRGSGDVTGVLDAFGQSPVDVTAQRGIMWRGTQQRANPFSNFVGYFLFSPHFFFFMTWHSCFCVMADVDCVPSSLHCLGFSALTLLPFIFLTFLALTQGTPCRRAEFR
uniref:Uncharacterized protein n=1 Tax=Trypanosoma congolense (strain IL3000) TaxID=1068625 RepID=G0USK1_TRYCI|nr:hypothetical protein, unlikely [Trypanosoma congolense IL3000]